MEDPTKFPAGVITLLQWTMMADGSAYMFVWAKEWKVVTNQASGIDGFKTAERWHAIAYGSDGTPLVIIPGCQVKGFAACKSNPSLKGGSQVYTVEQ